MTYEVVQTRRFSRAYKKLHNNLVEGVNAAVDTVATDPNAGVRKKGDLASLRVYKFRILKQLYLLGYTVDDEVQLIYLEAVGPHENFYRDLKR
jgi:mRNA-degrading endonuclease RelE of RelBE toxin-antitoxin system